MDDDRVPFNGRWDPPPPPRRSVRFVHEGHGPRCSSNPEVGCVCGREPDESAAPYAARDANGRIL
jgi:hypothetical protein